MKPLLISLAVAALFVAGVLGTYFLMPVVAPEKVMQARRYLDSLDAVAAGDTTLFAHSISPVPAASPDSAEAAGADPVVVEPGEAVGAPAEAPAAAGTSATPADPAPSPAEVAAAAQAEQARELSGVIAKLEDPELRALVSNLDPEVLAILYRESSARNKTRLLQAIPPERAAQFVRGLIVPVSTSK